MSSPFGGPQGKVGLVDLFEGRRQLIVQHFMFDPRWQDGCPSCSWAADEISEGRLRHLHEGDTTFAAVSRAPLPKIEDYYFEGEQPSEQPGYSCFLRDGDTVFHTYSTTAAAPKWSGARTTSSI